MCVLRAGGVDFDPDAFLATASMEATRVFRKGEPVSPNPAPGDPLCTASGMNISVSDATWYDLRRQVAEAEAFLATHRADLERLAASPGLASITLDFPLELRMDGEEQVSQSDVFPASLVRAAGALGIALAFSIYPPQPEEEEAPGTPGIA